MQTKLLFIDDDVASCEAIQETLEARAFDVTVAHSAGDALLALERTEFDVVVSDLRMPGMSGLELCQQLHARWPQLPVVLVTAFGSIELAVTAIRAGAYDFITKPIQIAELSVTLERALERRRLQQENEQLRETLARREAPHDMIGESVVMQDVYAMVGRLALTDVTVLITGESGTGKELVAQSIHRRGPHSSGRLVALNCAAVPESMLESELFGHARGAFTDARANHTGLFVQANGGTLFLDEIGEMSLSTQVKLLRALQERVVRPIGAEREVPFDARVVSATSRDLERDVAEHRFREDLYYRINVIRIHLPPLRARGNDVVLLAQHFIQRFAAQFKKTVTGLTAPATAKLLAYAWPGNVRELQNCLERAVVLTQGECISIEDLPEHIRGSAQVVAPSGNTFELLPMEEVERRYVLQVLASLHGSKSATAAALGFDRRTLYRKLKSYGVA